ncbi:MAG: hypothetical protein ACE5OZ_06380 [Candidatus Heimdallarchaeota archaeon]
MSDTSEENPPNIRYLLPTVVFRILIPSIAVIGVILILSAFLFGFEEEGITTTSFLLFFVGAFIAGVGALVSGGISESRLAGRGAYNPHSTREIMIVDERLTQRRKQIDFGLTLSGIGGLVIIFAIALLWGLIPFFS